MSKIRVSVIKVNAGCVFATAWLLTRQEMMFHGIVFLSVSFSWREFCLFGTRWGVLQTCHGQHTWSWSTLVKHSWQAPPWRLHYLVQLQQGCSYRNHNPSVYQKSFPRSSRQSHPTHFQQAWRWSFSCKVREVSDSEWKPAPCNLGHLRSSTTRSKRQALPVSLGVLIFNNGLQTPWKSWCQHAMCKSTLL